METSFFDPDEDSMVLIDRYEYAMALDCFATDSENVTFFLNIPHF